MLKFLHIYEYLVAEDGNLKDSRGRGKFSKFKTIRCLQFYDFFIIDDILEEINTRLTRIEKSWIGYY